MDIEQPQEIKDFLTAYARCPRGFVILSGKNGTGKTYAAQSVLGSFPGCMWDDKHFISQTDMHLKWNAELQEWGNTAPYLLKLCSYKLLVIDDLGTRTPSDAFMDFLYSLSDKRYANRGGCGTIITTNLNSNDMREKFGDAFVSRVASGTCFRIEGKDRRFKEF